MRRMFASNGCLRWSLRRRTVTARYSESAMKLKTRNAVFDGRRRNFKTIHINNFSAMVWRQAAATTEVEIGELIFSRSIDSINLISHQFTNNKIWNHIIQYMRIANAFVENRKFESLRHRSFAVVTSQSLTNKTKQKNVSPFVKRRANRISFAFNC